MSQLIRKKCNGANKHDNDFTRDDLLRKTPTVKSAAASASVNPVTAAADGVDGWGGIDRHPASARAACVAAAAAPSTETVNSRRERGVIRPYNTSRRTRGAR